MKLIDVGAEVHGIPEFLWALLLERDRDPVVNISHRKIPRLREHLEFVEHHPYRAWYIIDRGDGRWVGSVSISHRNEVGVQILNNQRRQGYAREALKRIMSLHTPREATPATIPACYVANINPANKPSIALFESLGAKLIQITYEIPHQGETA